MHSKSGPSLPPGILYTSAGDHCSHSAWAHLSYLNTNTANSQPLSTGSRNLHFSKFWSDCSDTAYKLAVENPKNISLIEKNIKIHRLYYLCVCLLCQSNIYAMQKSNFEHSPCHKCKNFF